MEINTLINAEIFSKNGGACWLQYTCNICTLHKEGTVRSKPWSWVFAGTCKIVLIALVTWLRLVEWLMAVKESRVWIYLYFFFPDLSIIFQLHVYFGAARISLHKEQTTWVKKANSKSMRNSSQPFLPTAEVPRKTKLNQSIPQFERQEKIIITRIREQINGRSHNRNTQRGFSWSQTTTRRWNRRFSSSPPKASSNCN